MAFILSVKYIVHSMVGFLASNVRFPAVQALLRMNHQKEVPRTISLAIKRHVNISTLMSTYPYLWYDIDRWSRIPIPHRFFFAIIPSVVIFVSFETHLLTGGFVQVHIRQGTLREVHGFTCVGLKFRKNDQWPMTSRSPKKTPRSIRLFLWGGELCSLTLS